MGGKTLRSLIRIFNYNFMASILLLKKCQNWVYDPDEVVFEMGLYLSWGCIVSKPVFDWGSISFSKPGVGFYSRRGCIDADTVIDATSSRTKFKIIPTFISDFNYHFHSFQKSYYITLF